MTTTTTAKPFWVHPDAAQPGDFLELSYGRTDCGQPLEASSAIYLHPWAAHDQIGLAAEVEITHLGTGLVGEDSGFRLRLITYQWSVWHEHGGHLHKFELYQGCTCQAWETAELLATYFDAEALAQFVWKRWRATGRANSAGLIHRDDLDNQLNPK